MTNKVRNFVIKRLAIGLAIGAGLVFVLPAAGVHFHTAAVVSPDGPRVVAPIDQDKAFLTFLAAKNVGITDPDDGISMGHYVCIALREEHVNRWMEGTRLMTLGYTGDEAATIVGASVAIYCQDQAPTYDNQRGY